MKNKINKPVLGWALYDFASSAYTTTIQSVLFGVYFVRVLVPPDGFTFLGWSIPGASLWAYLNAGVTAVVIGLAPFLGAWADRTLGKRRQLIFWASAGSLATLFYIGATPGRIVYGLAVAFLATLAYELSLVFYNAFLREVADEPRVGFVSGFGFSLGYIGGGLCLLLNMAMIRYSDWFGLSSQDPTWPQRAAFASVGLWWWIFSWPAFLWVKDSLRSDRLLEPGGSAFRELIESFRLLKTNRSAFRFIVAYLFYNDGIQTILLMAAVVGSQALGMSALSLGLCYLAIQFIAFFGAMIFGRLADRWSHRKVVLVTLLVYALVILWAVFMRSAAEFWVLGLVIGLILGGSQAASRSLFSLYVPVDRPGAFFGVYSIVGKASSLAGPLLFGVINQVWGLRPAMGSLIVFFIVGAYLLWGIQEPEKKSDI
jgi:UMF1 family MFS transporter